MYLCMLYYVFNVFLRIYPLCTMRFAWACVLPTLKIDLLMELFLTNHALVPGPVQDGIHGSAAPHNQYILCKFYS